MYSICGAIRVRQCAVGVVGTHLVAPEEDIALAVLEALPGVEELGDAVVADVVGVLLGLVPGQRGAEIQ